MGDPNGIACEKSVDEPHLINDKDTKGHADQATHRTQTPIKASGASFRKFERYGYGRRNNHHARDCSDPKYKQVHYGPKGFTDSCKNQQGHRRGPGETMNDSHSQRPDDLIQTQLGVNSTSPTICRSLRAGGL